MKTSGRTTGHRDHSVKRSMNIHDFHHPQCSSHPLLGKLVVDNCLNSCLPFKILLGHLHFSKGCVLIGKGLNGIMRLSGVTSKIPPPDRPSQTYGGKHIFMICAKGLIKPAELPSQCSFRELKFQKSSAHITELPQQCAGRSILGGVLQGPHSNIDYPISLSLDGNENDFSYASSRERHTSRETLPFRDIPHARTASAYDQEITLLLR
ncbi:hypothetical protein CDAR_66861 [Caerostris darwini]|uniref:Uncharacterized protein n=1 Tax=Caerostris darwini TaxID=1538125 RepID=A0AAV4QVL0_9ARAC|nr:hypothetical protein CDAR_66861 [Caerostris darwini]